MNSHFPMVFPWFSPYLSSIFAVFSPMFVPSLGKVPRQVDSASAQAADAIIALGQAWRFMDESSERNLTIWESLGISVIFQYINGITMGQLWVNMEYFI